MMRRVWLALACATVALGQAAAKEEAAAVKDAAVAAYAEAQEARIAERIKGEPTARRRLEMEYLLRQDYDIRLAQEREARIRSGKPTTPETEALRAERQALLRQVEALDAKIAKASEKAPEIVALDALRKTNDERLETLRNELLPPSQRKAQPAAK